jgi:threonine dehydrogenase-like Zn-dependent dehydrogenase
MRAVRCAGHAVEVVDVPAPRGIGVRVRIRSAGICGSDLHLLGSDFPLDHTLGHEMAGLAPDGTAVAIAEQIVVPERCLVRLPAGVAAEDACLVEPLAVAIHGLRRAGLRGDQRVAVVGGGSIGLCAVAGATSAGAEVGLVARHPAQREAGRRLGAREAQGSYDVVVDAAGSRDALAHALGLCRPGGILVLVATYWEGLELPGFDLCAKEVSVVPASLYARAGVARDVDVAAGTLAARPEIAQCLITHRFPLDAAAEAFAAARDREAGAIKVVLEP